MIRAYRMRGHLHANLDPLRHRQPLEDHNELIAPVLRFHRGRLRPQDLHRQRAGAGIRDHPGDAGHPDAAPIARRSASSSCTSPIPRRRPGSRRASKAPTRRSPSPPKARRPSCSKLIEAEGFEQFIDVKYKGTKRFGLDGGESLVPALEQIIKRGGSLGMKEIVLGMAHRGRLNVLTQVMAKPHRAMFHEFKGGSAAPDDVEGSGDVKYHLGASSDREFDGNKVHLSLTANPSHLEIVDPVVMGKARGQAGPAVRPHPRGDRAARRTGARSLLLHGDAALRRPGRRSPNASACRACEGHRVAGTLHFIINNQIGFTTNPRFSRSSPYPSDVAKMIEAPIFHVNGDDPEAVVYRRQGRDRIPHEVPQAGGGRHVLLPPLRPQ